MECVLTTGGQPVNFQENFNEQHAPLS